MNTFEIKSGQLIVTDPCYPREGEFIHKAKKGKWYAEVEHSEGCISCLIAKHESCRGQGYWKTVSSAGVDSGQMSIFDLSAYGDGEGEADDDGSFYNKCCRETCKSFDHRPENKDRPESDYEFGIVDECGAVSTSGLGDGCYPIEVIKEGDEIVAVRVTFIEEEVPDC